MWRVPWDCGWRCPLPQPQQTSAAASVPVRRQAPWTSPTVVCTNSENRCHRSTTSAEHAWQGRHWRGRALQADLPFYVSTMRAGQVVISSQEERHVLWASLPLGTWHGGDESTAKSTGRCWWCCRGVQPTQPSLDEALQTALPGDAEQTSKEYHIRCREDLTISSHLRNMRQWGP